MILVEGDAMNRAMFERDSFGVAREQNPINAGSPGRRSDVFRQLTGLAT